MITIYWSYKGYCGDKFYGDIVAKTAAEYAPKSRSVSARIRELICHAVGWKAWPGPQKGVGL